jgi:hypothetical protein
MTYIGNTNTGSNSSNTITIPSAWQAGDFVIAFDYIYGTRSGSVTSGWTLDQSNLTTASNGMALAVLHKVLEPGDPGSTLTLFTGSIAADKILACFRPDNPISEVTGSASGTISSTAPTAQTVTLSGVAVPIIVWGHFGSGGLIFSVPSNDFGTTNIQGNSLLHWMGYKTYSVGSTPPSSGDIGMNDAGDLNTLQAGYFAFV